MLRSLRLQSWSLQLLWSIVTIFSISNAIGQEFKIDADYRARGEYSHGFGTLIQEESSGALFVQQRARLKFGYTDKKLSAYMSFQDVSVWGDHPQISAQDDNNSLSLTQAWVEFKASDYWSFKGGRQVLSYDDQRIFGGLDWAMQGRFHDALLIKHKKNNFQFDLGLAFNQNGISRQNTLFDPNNTGNVRAVFDYKVMAYLWLHKEWNNVKGSFLFSNNAYQNLNGQVPVSGHVQRQTFGAHVKITPSSHWKVLANLYMQTGEFVEGVDLQAYNTLLEVNYKPRKTTFGLGYEILSGDDDGMANGEISSFFPIFGTNHKFNGFMDYFYVGNHANSIGLRDLYGKVVANLGGNSNLLVKAHYFSGDKELANDSYLGTEIDIVYSKKILPYATLKIGYSQLFASDTMKLLKNVPNAGNTQNWGWAMVVVKPNFLTWKKK
ncbi:alginate export family protein [Tenacibaculum xiamenense]|uniref:alginate export family protein n=1 Tax=Tenacibaculum xiamenense TaxID=1261553 RepID=UPI0038966A9D